MPATFKQLADFLVDLGIETVPHTQKNYLAHLISVYKLMESAGLDAELCRAGLFHSIYGTQAFQGFKLPLDGRAQLAELIGNRAERLAYWNCLMDRSTLDNSLGQIEEPFLIRNRESGETMSLSRREFDDLCCIHLFDWLEQAERWRFGWDYRREAYRQMAHRVGRIGIETLDRVYARAPDAVHSSS